jgi:hypothetical protein
MRSILLSELRRYRAAILAATAVHLLLLGLAAMSDPFFLVSPTTPSLAGLAYAASGLLLGFHQIAAYRREHWLFLIHRPLAPNRIALALLLAAGLALAIAVLLPLALVTALQAFGSTGVDPRHFLLGPYAWGLAVAFHLAGMVIALKPWRGAWLAASPALLALVPGSLGAWVFLPLLFILLWLGGLAVAALRPDLSTPPRGRLATAAGVAPALAGIHFGLSMALLLVYSVGVATYEDGWRGIETFSWDDHFPEGTYPRTTYLDFHALLDHGLALMVEQELGIKADQVTDAAQIAPDLRPFPRRFQPSFLDQGAFLDNDAPRRRWVFRHDQMAFEGRELSTGKAAGWLGASPGKSDAYGEVPRSDDGELILTPRRLDRFDHLTSRIEPLFELPATERFVGLSQHQPFDMALSDRALYLFAPGAFQAAAPLAPLLQIPHESEVANLQRILVGRLGERWLVSIVEGTRSEREVAPARQRLLILGADGRAERGAAISLDPGIPAFIRYRGYVLSPTVQTSLDLGLAALYGPGEGPSSLRELAANPPPPRIQIAGLLAMALASAATWRLASRRALDPASRRAWTLAAFLAGLPVPLALLLFTPRKH